MTATTLVDRALLRLSGDDLLGINQTYGTVTLASLPNHSDTFLLQTPLGANVEKMLPARNSKTRLSSVVRRA
mgnify:CR=1 FL=1